MEESERALFGWAGSCLLLTGAAAFALMNCSETLFLKRVGVEWLPAALLASSTLLLGTTGLVARRAGADPLRWLPRVFLLLAALLLPFALLVDTPIEATFAALLLVARQVLALALLAFWMALGNLVTSRQAKRLFAPLAAGITLGGIVGSFGSDPVARVVGIEGLLVVCAALLVGAAWAAAKLRQLPGWRLDRGVGRPRTRRAGGSPPQSSLRLRRLVAESRLFRLLLPALFLGGALSPVLYFEFSYAADLATQGGDGEERLLALYAQFRGWLNVVMLAMQLWLSGRIYQRLGLPLALALWPAAYLLGFGWLGVAFALSAGVLSLGSARVMEDGIAGSALRVLYNLFPDAERARASGLLEGPVNRLGGVVGNGVTLLAVVLGWAPLLVWLALPAALFWLALAVALWRAYPALLLQASANRNLDAAGADKVKLLDAGTLRALAPKLADPDPGVCRAAIDLVRDAEPALAVTLLAQAVERASAGTRSLVVEALQRLVEPLAPGSLRSEPATRALARVLGGASGPPPEQRADLVQVYARLTGGEKTPAALARESNALLERAMGDRAAPVRLAAIAELTRRGRRPPGVADLDRALSGALAGRDVLVRRAARKELRSMLLSTPPDAVWNRRLALLAERLEQRSDRAETAEALLEVARRHDGQAQPCAERALRFRDDRDPRVRAALLAFCGHVGLVAEGPQLVAALASRDPSESRGAREGLVALGPAAALPLLTGLHLGAARQRDAAMSVLQELEVDSESLEALRSRQLADLHHVVMMRAALEGAPEAELLRRRLEERVSEGVGTLLALLAVLRDDPRLAELERRLRRTRDDRQRDLLIEGIEALLGARDRSELVPQLEAGRWPERGARAGEALGRRLPGAPEAVAELLRDSDALTRRLAESWRARAVEGEAPIGDPLRVLSPMDIAVKLQAMPAFERLSTQQVMGLADVLQEQRAEAGETIYAEGEEGSWLYFILEGEIALSKGARVVQRLEPGSFFGEQSAIDGVPRPLTARAESAARLLRLGREDLLSLMEEVPSLAVGLAQFLSLELRKLQDGLA